jgi:hypothetical protein
MTEQEEGVFVFFGLLLFVLSLISVSVLGVVALSDWADRADLRRRASPYCKSTSSNQFQHERCLDYASQD